MDDKGMNMDSNMENMNNEDGHSHNHELKGNSIKCNAFMEQ